MKQAKMERHLATSEKLAQMIDHTRLNPESTGEDIERLCEEAINCQVWAVCINPVFVPLAKSLLSHSSVKICSVIGFPFGATAWEVKVFEGEKAIRDGAHELDVVASIGALTSGNFSLVEDEVREIVAAAKRVKRDAIVKLIIECCFLDDSQKIESCKVAMSAGADFVKTSTGFGPHGATIYDVKLLRKTVGPNFGVKAAGGIRSLEDAIAMIEAGANRIGTSSTVRILGHS
ncbi:MAG: deoxyribose-phosphate aldolase [Dehalococcoidia bacterium]|nr:deoxyribose-phosphate aldolase [Dehalococcoidia bacterium]